MHIVDLPYHQLDPLAVAARFVDQIGCVLLDSAARDQHGRYSFVAADPWALLRSNGGTATLTDTTGTRAAGDPWTAMHDLWWRYRLPLVVDLPPLQGGLIGFWSYDLGRQIEQVPAPPLDDLRMPDLWLGAYDWVIAWDHVAERCWLISTGLPAHATDQIIRARQRADQVLRALDRSPAVALDDVPAALTPPDLIRAATYPLDLWPGMRSTFTAEAFMAAVDRAIRYIYAGDVYQVNLSQRLEALLAVHPWQLYTALREHNPAAFAAYLNCGDHAVASASPERFVRLAEGVVETRPIKGTIARSPDPTEDAQRARTLHTSAKDRAENLMIVDLLRNDLGRVCQIGSVHVPELWTIEQHPTVYHLVSTVRGQARAGLTPFDLLRACLPGGSITGAPKIRAMEIITELEPTARGVYCGAIGYVGWNGAMDTNIVIRTLIAARGRAVWQVGGGVVADSTPAGEYAETLAKAQAISDVVRQSMERHVHIG